MKKFPLKNKVVILVMLAVFALTGCHFFVMPEPDAIPDRPWSLIPPPLPPPQLGFTYLDSMNRATTEDNGTMAMFTFEHRFIGPILVIADLPENDTTNDLTVRVRNNHWQNLSEILAVYSSNSNTSFPREIAITFRGQTIIGRFSAFYNNAETYTVAFYSTDNTEKARFEDLILNRGIFDIHKDRERINDSQNLRLNKATTTIALLNSLRLQINNERWLQSSAPNWVRDTFSGAVSHASLVAFSRVVIASPLEAVAQAGAAISINPATISQLVSAGASPPPAFFTLPPPPPPRPPAPVGPLPKVTIMRNGKPMENNHNEPIFLATVGDAVTFEIAITNQQGFRPEDIIETENLFFRFEPRQEEIILPGQNNAAFFDLNTEPSADGATRLTISRGLAGFFYPGRVQFVIRFAQRVEINGVDDSGYIWVGHDHKKWGGELRQTAEPGYLFILNFSSLAPPSP